MSEHEAPGKLMRRWLWTLPLGFVTVAVWSLSSPPIAVGFAILFAFIITAQMYCWSRYADSCVETVEAERELATLVASARRAA